MFSYHRIIFTNRARYARAVRRFFQITDQPGCGITVMARGHWETPGTWYIEYWLKHKTPVQI